MGIVKWLLGRMPCPPPPPPPLDPAYLYTDLVIE